MIRHFRPDDQAAVRQLVLAGLRERWGDAYDPGVNPAEDGSVLGRFNLVFVGDGVAELGYRVAQHVAGRGVATATVRDLCHLAASRHGLTKLRAATAEDNEASRRVLVNAGFSPVGPADPADVGGKHGTWHERDLTAEPSMASDASTPASPPDVEPGSQSDVR